MQDAASTAVHRDADPLSSFVDVDNSMVRKHHAAATANPYLACVREEQHPPRRCCSWTRQTKLMLASIIILVGAVLGLGLYVGLSKGKRGPMDAQYGCH
jgi:hypothetical protein